MLVYEMYHSASKQSFTLIKKGNNDAAVLEKDAKLIETITTCSQENASKIYNDLIVGKYNKGKI